MATVLKVELVKRDMYNRDLADIVGKQISHIQKITRGDIPCAEGLAHAISIHLDVPIEILFEERRGGRWDDHIGLWAREVAVDSDPAAATTTGDPATP